MIEQGMNGRLDLVVETARRIIAEGTGALAAVPPSARQHGRDTVEELNDALSEARYAMTSAEQGRQDEAVAHAKKVLSHARRGLSHAEAL